MILTKIKKLSHSLYMKIKHYAWFWGPVVATALGFCVAWIASVNATGETVVELKTIMPRIETQIKAISEKQDETNRSLGSMDRRLSNIEGRLSVSKSP